MSQNVNFVPGGQTQTQKKEKSDDNRQNKLSILPWMSIVGAMFLLGGYSGILYIVEQVMLVQPIQELKVEKKRILSENSDIWPRTSSVPVFLASADAVIDTEVSIPSLIALLQSTNNLEIVPSSLSYTQSTKALEVEVRSPSLDTVNQVQRRLKEDEQIKSVEIPEISRAESGARSFTLRLVIQ